MSFPVSPFPISRAMRFLPWHCCRLCCSTATRIPADPIQSLRKALYAGKPSASPLAKAAAASSLLPPLSIFSGIQPSGALHLGNYFGALQTWKRMQDAFSPAEMTLRFCLVDLHSITVPQDPNSLRRSILECTAALLAIGIDPKRSIILQQSLVPQHAELMWILNCICSIGKLRHMTQFKSKEERQKEASSIGLLSYPVLMAADILLYGATHIPVGEDQTQHIELARDLAMQFNHRYQSPLFVVPEYVYGVSGRVMSLRDGTQKMSKSDPSDMSRINLSDSAEAVVSKIRKAKSDLEPVIFYDPARRPEVSNLLELFSALTSRSIDDICVEYGDGGMAKFKAALADAAVAVVGPISVEIHRLLANDRNALLAVLQQGSARARQEAEQTMQLVRQQVGFSPVALD